MSRTASVAAVFATFFVLLATTYATFPAFFDADSYYHLAVARLYVAHGFVNALEWARFSVMHDRFGDKDFLFHVFLMPFVARGDPSTGGVIALAVLGALVAAAIAWVAMEAIGGWGLFVPVLVFATATDFTLRIIRLRPELLSLALLLVVIRLAASGRCVALAVACAAYALAYTGFHVVVALMLLFLLYRRATGGRWTFSLVAWPLVGMAAGLCAHPGFPDNLRIWTLQNVTFFLHNPTADFGPEILARTTRDVLVLNAGWWATMVLLWHARGADRVTSATGELVAVSALMFGLLYALMGRFVLYAIPLATLALLSAMDPRSASPRRRVRLVGPYAVPLAAGLVAALACGAATTWLGARRVVESAGRVFRPGIRADFEAFGAAVPAGARVFAPWAATEEFVFWAPQGRYLNVLDPIFMAARDPALYQAYRDVVQGTEPDIPLLVATRFDSEFFADDGQYPVVRSRLDADPRAALVRDGVSYLYRFAADGNRDFILDWKVVPAGMPPSPSLDVLAGPALAPYPRAESRVGRAVEGFVDGGRVGTGCTTFARVEHASEDAVVMVEIAPYGAAELYVDGALRVGVTPRAAYLGRGDFVPLMLSAGDHAVAIRTCPSAGRTGFYAVRRAIGPA